MIKKLHKRFSDFWEGHKNERLFKAKVLIAVLLVLAAAVKIYDTHRTEKEVPQETSVSEEADEEDPVTLEKIIMENKAHIVLFIGLTAALAVVKLRQQHKFKDSK